MLIKNHEDLKKYVEINTGIKYPSIAPSIELAEQAHIIPIIGKSFYDRLNEDYNVETPEYQEHHEIILIAIQKALASLAMANYVPMADVQISDAGITNANSGDQKAAYKYQVQNLQNAHLQRGLLYLESLIEALETNASGLDFWTGSDEFKKYRSLFINNGKLFGELYSNSRHPRQLYMQLNSTMVSIEEFTIKPIITSTIYTDLKTKLADVTPALSDKEKQLLLIIQRAIAFMSLHDAIPQLNVRIDNNGISVLSQVVDTTADDSGKRTSTSDTQLSFLLKNCYDMGQKWLSHIVTFLNENATANDFPTWYETMQAAVTNPAPPPSPLRSSYSM